MCRSKLALFCLAVAVPAWAEVAASSPRWHGVIVRFVPELQPEAAGKLPFSGHVVVHDTVISRVLQDEPHKAYFGYDLDLEPLPDSKIFRVHIQPLSLPPDRIGPGWTKLALPKYPVIPDVHSGQTLAIDLLVNPSTGQKIVDYITLAPETPEPAEPARDFTTADAEMLLDRPRVHVNGTLVESTAAYSGGIEGVTVAFYLAGHGRFILSLRPLPELGFHRIGEVFESTLIVHDGGAEYRLDCARRIAPGSGRFHVYGIHNPSWIPKRPDAGEDFLLGAGSPEWLIRN